VEIVDLNLIRCDVKAKVVAFTDSDPIVIPGLMPPPATHIVNAFG